MDDRSETYAHKDTVPFVYILILNWNGWRDTIECLESVFRISHTAYRVIVCDNGSDDDSFQRIIDWADGNLKVTISENNPLHHLSNPPITKPISYTQYDRENAESGGNSIDSDTNLILIQTGANCGFAGGNNVGLRYALARDDFSFIWLLNNDAVVAPDALTYALQRMSVKPHAGTCGSTLMYYNQPDQIQALGGAAYNKWFGVPRRIQLQANSLQIDPDVVERKLAYIIGASMLISKEFLLDIGLLAEDYFLCFEEIDWAERSRDQYELCYAPESVVYHKDGNSIGHPEHQGGRSYIADYYNIGNRLVFTRKFHRWAIPTVYIGLVITMLNRLRKGQWDRARMVLNLIINGRK